jgi:hypothetical protein
LIGTWEYKDRMQQCRYSFDSNGTFAGYVQLHGQLVSKFTGRWAFENGAIFYRYGSDRLGRIPPGTADRDTVLSFGSDNFEIEAADGSRRKYTRVR